MLNGVETQIKHDREQNSIDEKGSNRKEKSIIYICVDFYNWS